MQSFGAYRLIRSNRLSSRLIALQAVGSLVGLRRCRQRISEAAPPEAAARQLWRSETKKISAVVCLWMSVMPRPTPLKHVVGFLRGSAVRTSKREADKGK